MPGKAMSRRHHSTCISMTVHFFDKNSPGFLKAIFSKMQGIGKRTKEPPREKETFRPPGSSTTASENAP
jgi:hypothetical protein